MPDRHEHWGPRLFIRGASPAPLADIRLVADRAGRPLVGQEDPGDDFRNSLAPARLRVGWSSRLALRPTIPARERFYADTRLARRGNAPLRQTGSTAGLVLFLEEQSSSAARALSPIAQERLTHASRVEVVIRYRAR